MDEGMCRFGLHHGVTFSDGTPIEAQDVTHLLVRTKCPDIAPKIVVKVFGDIDITSDIVDPYTLDKAADLAQPILPMLMFTVTMTPQHTPLDRFLDQPIGTVPYLFYEYVRGQSRPSNANPNHWGDQPTVQSATYVFRSHRAVRAAMGAAGEADIAPIITLQDAADPGVAFSYPTSRMVFLRIEHAQVPLNDRRMRDALNLAVDREAIVAPILLDGTMLAAGIPPPSQSARVLF